MLVVMDHIQAVAVRGVAMMVETLVAQLPVPAVGGGKGGNGGNGRWWIWRHIRIGMAAVLEAVMEPVTVLRPLVVAAVCRLRRRLGGYVTAPQAVAELVAAVMVVITAMRATQQQMRLWWRWWYKTLSAVTPL